MRGIKNNNKKMKSEKIWTSGYMLSVKLFWDYWCL